jgi:hypothetical protein
MLAAIVTEAKAAVVFTVRALGPVAKYALFCIEVNAAAAGVV